MNVVYVFGLLAALFHFQFFVLESILWGTPLVNKLFKMQAEVAQSQAVRSFAFNMGFYNLFLSLGTLGSLAGIHNGCTTSPTLLGFCCASMVGASVVLLVSSGKKRLVGAIMQGVPPALCLLGLWRG